MPDTDLLADPRHATVLFQQCVWCLWVSNMTPTPPPNSLDFHPKKKKKNWVWLRPKTVIKIIFTQENLISNALCISKIQILKLPNFFGEN